MHRLFEEAVTSRDVTKRRFVEGALRQELANPTVFNEQEGLCDVA